MHLASPTSGRRLFYCRRQSGVAASLGWSSPPGGAGAAAAVEVAAELREVDRGGSRCRPVEAEVSGCYRFPGLLHRRERREHLLLWRGGRRERRSGRREGHAGGRGQRRQGWSGGGGASVKGGRVESREAVSWRG